MRRREFISLVGGAAAIGHCAARAQQPVMPVVGFLRSTTRASSTHLVATFQQGLKESGLVEGQTFYDRISLRPTIRPTAFRLWPLNSRAAPWPSLSQTILRLLRPRPPPRRYRLCSSSGSDPVRDGLVASLNRPGGNVTGVTFLAALLGAKRLELLRQLVPKATTIGMLVQPGHSYDRGGASGRGSRGAGDRAAAGHSRCQQRARHRASLCNLCPARGRRAVRWRRTVLTSQSGTARRAGGAPCAAGDLLLVRICRGRRSDELWRPASATPIAKPASTPDGFSRARSPPTCR